ncbi:MAG: hypothetical protein OEM97_01095 [Acidimicrobiia bacterium]|nr:hypothetical protein [Acidimicrobiia bacterium]
MRIRSITASLVATVVALSACAGEAAESPVIAPTATTLSPGASAAQSAGASTTNATATPSTVAPSTTTPDADLQACADVIDGSIRALDDGAFSIEATVRSGDTGWDKYADSWEVRTVDGATIDVRVLTHPHETEQPFTRSLSPVVIPDDIDEIVLIASDSVNGFCGETATLKVP